MAIDRKRAARAALELLNDQGLDRLTVRRVATHLGVKAPALYWHFADKRALLDEMTDVMLVPVATRLGRPAPGRPWWQWLEEACGALRRGLLDHRDGARVASGADILRARSLGVIAERITEVLEEAGFALGDVSRAAGALVHFVIGRVVEEQTRPATDAELAIVSEDGFPFPALARSLRERHASGRTADDDFRYSLSLMLSGLRTVHDRAGAAEDSPPESRASRAPS